MKYSRIYANVNLGAIGKNVEEVRKIIPNETKIMAVIKANAYGHGSAELSQYLEDKADWFGVATVDEGCELRRNGTKKPILVLGYVHPEEYYAVAENKLDITLFSTEDAELINAFAEKNNTVINVHVKIDTGMGRIGFAANEANAKNIMLVSKLSGINIRGIYSHFACADSCDKSSAREQSELFDGFVDNVRSLGVDFEIKHIDNSAGIIEGIGTNCNMVRMGIILYGLYPSADVDQILDLKPAMELKSSICYIKRVKKGTGISYGHTYVTDEEKLIATVPVGYADGYPRLLSNKGFVLVNGHRCPVVGRVCMDQMMIDISKTNAKRGDEVILVGKQGTEEITFEEIAALCDTINYEIICGVSRRVPRCYYLDGKCVDEISYI